MPITLLDGILLVIVLISAILAMIRGFSREVLSIVSWVVAAAAALYLFPSLTPFVQSTAPELFANALVAQGVSALIIFLLVLIIVSYLTMLLADMIIDSRIGVLDRTLGFLFGAARGMLLVAITLMGFLWLANEQEPTWVAEAKSKPMLVAVGTAIRDALPDNLDEVVQGVLGTKDPETGNEAEQDPETKT
ncbi:MAG: CvpA family protein [Pseudomonadota bacterium]